MTATAVAVLSTVAGRGPVSPALAPIPHGNSGISDEGDSTQCLCRCEFPNYGGFHEWSLVVVCTTLMAAAGGYSFHLRRATPVQAPLPPPPAPGLPLPPAP